MPTTYTYKSDRDPEREARRIASARDETEQLLQEWANAATSNRNEWTPEEIAAAERAMERADQATPQSPDPYKQGVPDGIRKELIGEYEKRPSVIFAKNIPWVGGVLSAAAVPFIASSTFNGIVESIAVSLNQVNYTTPNDVGYFAVNLSCRVIIGFGVGAFLKTIFEDTGHRNYTNKPPVYEIQKVDDGEKEAARNRYGVY